MRPAGTGQPERSGVAVGLGGLVAPGGGGPGHDSGLELFEAPAFRLFTAMMVPAQRGQAAFAGPAALIVGSGVVQVAAGGSTLAAGGRAGGGPGLDEVLEGAAGLVARFFVPVVAAAAGQRGEGHGEAAGGELLPSAGAGQAAVADGLPILAGDGEAEPGPGGG